MPSHKFPPRPSESGNQSLMAKFGRCLTRKAVVDKSEIAAAHAMEGKLNLRPFIIEGQTYAPRTLRYAGFSGRFIDSRKQRVDWFGRFGGWHCFDVLHGEQEGELIDFQALPGLDPDSQPSPSSASKTGSKTEPATVAKSASSPAK